MLTVTARRSIPTLLATLLMAACGQGGSHMEGADLAGTAAPEPPGLMPGWFLEGFPPPPDGAVFHSAIQSENAMVMQHYTEEPRPNEEKGTVVSHGVQLNYGTGTADQVEEVLDHYRAALPEAGWEIISEEEIDPDERPDREYPETRLRFDAHGHQGTVTVSPREDHVQIGLGVSEQHHDRAPYSTYPPMIELPEWYASLPEPPEQIRRSMMEVRYQQPHAASTYWFEYEQYSLAGQEGDVASVADHYRGLLQQSGWQITDEEQLTEEEELAHTTHRQDRMVLEIAGHGVSGRISVSQSSWTEGEWTPASVTVIIDG